MAKSKYGYESETAEETAVASPEPAPEELSPKAIDPLQVVVDKLTHATTLDLQDRLAAMQSAILALIAAVKEKTDGNK